jgi:protein ImuA
MPQASTLADLRRRIAVLERHAPPEGLRRARAPLRQLAPKVETGVEDGVESGVAGERACSLGAEAADARFALGGLAYGVHEAAGAPGDRAAAVLFALLWLARLFKAQPGRPALLVQEAEAVREDGALYGPGLHALGLDPGRLALVQARDGAEALRVIDQAVRSGAVCAVMGELRRGAARLDLALTQRLNVHAQQTSTLTALITPDLSGTSAALSRWRVRAAASRAPRHYLGPPALDVELIRNRHGRPGRWTLEWSSEDEAFRLPAPLRAPVVSAPAHRPDPPRPFHPGGYAPGAGREVEVRAQAYGGR